MLKADSVTYSFASFIVKAWKKEAPSQTSKIKANYKDTRITVNEAAMCPFLSLLHLLVCWGIPRNKKLAGNLKEIYIKQSPTH